MACPSPRLCLAASLGLGTLAAAAQPNPDARPTDRQRCPVFVRLAPIAPNPPNRVDRPRLVSPAIAAELAATMPSYTPIPADPPRTPAAALDANDPAVPKNGIVRLPKYVVHETRLRPFTERELYTPAGLREIAVKRYITEFDAALNAFRIPLFSGYSTAEDRGNSPEKRAMRAYDEAEAEKRSADMADLEALDHLH
jgi:hypothetical protein